MKTHNDNFDHVDDSSHRKRAAKNNKSCTSVPGVLLLGCIAVLMAWSKGNGSGNNSQGSMSPILCVHALIPFQNQKTNNDRLTSRHRIQQQNIHAGGRIRPSRTNYHTNARSYDTASTPTTTKWKTETTSSLFATVEDNTSPQHSNNEDSGGPSFPEPSPRRTRRVDDILYGEADDFTNRDREDMTISSLESSLQKEKERSNTLAIRLAYAEKVIAEQKARLEDKRSSLNTKNQALTETRRKLSDLERQLNLQQQSSTKLPPKSSSQATSPPWLAKKPPLTSNERQYPLLENWALNPNTGEIRATVTCHPSIPDGTTIVTSGLDKQSFQKAHDPNFEFMEGKPANVVTTQTGSKYQLGVKKRVAPAAEIANLQPPAVRRPAVGSPPLQFQQQQTPPTPQQQAQQQQQQTPPLHPSNERYPDLEFPLTGQSISNGLGTKYLLAGSPKRKPSGRSEIIMGYKCNEQMSLCDVSTPVVIKLSTHKEKLLREYKNYQKIQDSIEQRRDGKRGGLFGGIFGGDDSSSSDSSPSLLPSSSPEDPFVLCYDFFPVCQGSLKYAQHSALVMEKGYEDLRDFEYRLQIMDDAEYPVPTTIDPAVVQAALKVAAKGLQTLHSKAKVVYTDLKAENLIFMEPQDQLEPPAIATIKGIDLESCIPIRGNPLDYTPEASPPEFAVYHLQGNPYDFVLDYSYDVWSFGMLAYELATGRPYFRGNTPEEIMHILGDPSFVPPQLFPEGGAARGDLPDLADLVRSCLQVDPRQRISVSKILKHPYFRNPIPPPGGGAEESDLDSPFNALDQQQRLGGTFW